MPTLRFAKKTKWNNTRCEIDGITFDSKAEMHRYGYLKTMQKVGLITELTGHPRYVFHVNGFKLWSYKPDFRYRDMQTGVLIVEDVKNPANAKSRDFIRNCKMMQACFGIAVKVVTNEKEGE